ncbi:fascin-2b isoform X2 [Hippocampus zosterae]|uniref:fascin-2b isoform X2 n=1 Tax=Hippocampus zosterae TaxID=109293 RepID=UPI00223CE6CA|nr:fascin-2b isoform X2 [Hippocampus zosterae]
MPSNGNQPLTLQFGLINHEGRYLTAERFGYKVNASAPSMKKKQIWTLEQDSQAAYLRSHLRRYLASDKDGRVTCEADGRHSDCRFLIVAQSDGRWALRSERHLRFFGGSGDRLSCFAQGIGDGELWAVHLALHPRANLLSVARKRYARLSAEDGQISVDANVPWGVAAILTLVYRNGKYCLKTCDGRFLGNDGKLVQQSGRTATYTLELKCGKLAFKDCEGKYLSPVGPAGTLRSGRCSKAGKDELFDLEESHPQVVLMAANGKYVSMRQGVSLAANQEDETEMETFQMEMNKENNKCTFRTSRGNYWALVAHGSIQTTATQVSANSLFAMEWLGHKMALKANNGKYICTKKNGQLLAVSESIGEDEQLSLKLVNRPTLILRGENGFICHHKNSNTLDASRSVYDIFSLQFSDGAYHIQGANGRFWYVDSGGLVCSDGEVPEDFSVELPERGRLAIRSSGGRYLRGDQGGTLKADGLSLSSSALWEY